ncbi:MAG: FAD-dependent oxidoreductase [Candidatus Pacebacteria bacterium]|nr:FAD-dependent oxidoreductase [Candidatus Paceibacterota bacterium]
MEYELIIIGAGPAGTAAGVYAARKQLKTLLIAQEFGGQSIVSETIYNWIGSPEIGGGELAESFKKHLEYYQGEFLKLEMGTLVTTIEQNGDGFTVTTGRGDSFTTQAILIATGSGRRKLTVPGADTFDNKGVVYCASCDGPLFSGQDVAVIGGGNAGFESASQLAQYCKSVTILQRSDVYKAEQVTVEKILARPNVTGILNADITEVLGDKFVSGLTYKDEKGDIQKLDVTGIFVEIGQIPNTAFAENIVELDEFKRITIDPWTQRSSTPGIWVAGDCSDVLYHQNNIAAGDGVRALEDIYNYLYA